MKRNEVPVNYRSPEQKAVADGLVRFIQRNRKAEEGFTVPELAQHLKKDRGRVINAARKTSPSKGD